MGGYLVNFGVYTMAMIGLIFFALMVYKKFTAGSFINSKSKNLHIEETLSLGPRKTLYVVRAGEERFLIAGDVDKTSLISKLETSDGSYMSNIGYDKSEEKITENYSDIRTHKKTQSLPKPEYRVDDLSMISGFGEENEKKNVLHSMIRKINR